MNAKQSRIRISLAGCIVLGLVLTTTARAEIRSWKDRNGGTVEAELIAAYNDKAYFITQKGLPFYFPIVSFAHEDAEFVMAWAVANEEARRQRVPVKDSDSPLTKFLRTRLVVPAPGKKGFEKLDVGDRLEPEFYVFYEGANWCGPCHLFCPVLTTFYRAMKAGGDDNFEVIFLSADRSESDMRTYMNKMEMPWPAVRFRDAEDRMFRNYGGRYVPRLVVTDRQGRVLLHSELGSGDDSPGAHETLSSFAKILNASNRHKRPSSQSGAKDEGS